MVGHAGLKPGAVDRALDELGWDGAARTATAFGERLLGLIALAPVDARGMPRILVFPRCRSVHTCFMRYPLDIAFIDTGGDVLVRYDAVPPWRFLRCPEAAAALERPSVGKISLTRFCLLV